jgi:hypothetical protein
LRTSLGTDNHDHDHLVDPEECMRIAIARQ